MISNTEKSSQILKEEIQRLEEQGISGHILEELMEFRRENDTGEAAEERCIRPQIPFFGKEVLEMAITCCSAAERPPGKIFLQKILPGFLEGQLIIFLFMSIQTAVH